MWTIRKRFKFEAAHHLPGHELCGSNHGHSWKGEIVLQGNKLNKMGMLRDFTYLDSLLRDPLETLDHSDLNDIFQFPSCELVAKWLYDVLVLDRKLPELVAVVIQETEDGGAEYRPS